MSIVTRRTVVLPKQRLDRNATLRKGKRFVLVGLAAIVGLISFLLSPFATADPIESQLYYGDLVTPRVGYYDITETSTTDDFGEGLTEGEIGHYGLPSLEGDMLSFDTPRFAATIFPGPGIDLTDGFLSLGMMAGDGYVIETVGLHEFGSIAFTTPHGGSETTLVDVDAPVFLTLFDVLLDDGTPEGEEFALQGSLTIAATMNVTPAPRKGMQWNSMDDSDVTTWQGRLEIDLPDRLADLDPTVTGGKPIRGATRLELRMNNLLTAVSGDSSSSAFIDKKGIFLSPGVIQVVPEPTKVAPVLVGLSLLCFWRSRRNRQQG